MNEITNTAQQDMQATKLAHLMMLLKKHIVGVICGTMSIIVVVAVIVFSLPRTYNSQTILLPETTSESISGNIGQMASLVGVKLGNNSEDAIYPEFYPKVLGSTVFLTELMRQQVTLQRENKKVSVFDYFAKYQKKAWWGNLFSFKKKEEVSSNINPIKITKKQQLIVNMLTKSFHCMVDKKTDMVTVNVEVQDPEVAAQIADMIRVRLQNYITDYRTNKVRHDLDYAKKIVGEARTQYIKSQQKYAAYCDANEDVMLASFMQVRDRLENEMQMAYNMYQQSVQQMQLAQAKLQERTPVFVTIQPATIPSKPSGPKRMIIMIVFAMVGFFGSISWILLKDYYNTKLSNAFDKDKAEPQQEQ